MPVVTRRSALAFGAASVAVLSTRTLAQTGPLDGMNVIETINVVSSKSEFSGRPCLKLVLTEEAQKIAARQQSIASIALLPIEMTSGSVEIDIAGVVNGKGDPDARAFVGLAFHATTTANAYQAIYLRLTNGRLASPPPSPPRDARAVQYIAHPNWHFDKLRQSAPGAFEKGADVAPGRWFRLKLEITATSVQAFVDGALVLSVDQLKDGLGKGRLGLFVDDGTDGYFANLKVSPK